MKLTAFAGILCLSILASAQEVRFNYDRGASFSSYRTYQWINQDGAANQLMDQNIRRAIEEQLATKGLIPSQEAADLQISYQAGIQKEKQLNGYATGPRWFGNGMVTTSTVEIGHLVVDIVDSSRKQLVWRGDAQKTLDLKKDPEKNYRDLQKAMAKLFANYPPSK
jgi:hypothetical protein